MSSKKRETLSAIGFLLPNFLGFFLFVAFPLIFSLVMVFTNWSLKPAVHTRFTALDNVWHLVGFRPIVEAEISGGLGWIAAFIVSFALFGGGVLLTLAALTRKWPGLRLAGWLGLIYAVVLIARAAFGSMGIGAGLIGLTMIFGYFFLVTDDDTEFSGKAIVAPIALIVAMESIYLLWEPTLARWEPLDRNFYYYLFNTMYLMVGIPINIAGSLFLAIILSEPLLKTGLRNRSIIIVLFLILMIVGAGYFWFFANPDFAVMWVTFWIIALLGVTSGPVAFRTLFYLPTFTAGIAVMLLWKQILNPNFGPLNEGLRMVFGVLGIDAEPPLWLTEIAWAKPAIMLMGFWIIVGGQNMLLYLAGLANVAPELYEAANMDGANRLQKFWNVTWPQLAPTTFFIVIMNTIAGLQGGFEQARVMTRGGPAGSTKTLSYYIYEKAFEELDLGYAAGIAWILFLMIFILTALNWRFGNRYANY